MTNEPKPLEAEVLPTQAVAVREQQPAALPTTAALTPAQAKVDAVANLTMKAYERAAGMRGKAVEFAARYDADRVLTQYWKPVLDELTPWTR